MFFAKSSLFDGHYHDECVIVGIFAVAVLTLVVTAIVGNRQLVIKPLLKLTDEDYNEHGLQELIASRGGAYDINIEVFKAMQNTITGWPGLEEALPLAATNIQCLKAWVLIGLPAMLTTASPGTPPPQADKPAASTKKAPSAASNF